jgi:hypothetical protein
VLVWLGVTLHVAAAWPRGYDLAVGRKAAAHLFWSLTAAGTAAMLGLLVTITYLNLLLD